LELGLGFASLQYISEYLVHKDEDKIRKAFWSCLLAYIFLGLVGTGLIYFSAYILIKNFLKIPSELKAISVFYLKLGSVGFLTSRLIGAMSIVVRALGRFDMLNRLEITINTLQIIIMVIILKLGFSLKEIIISSIVIQAIGIYIYWIITKNLLPFLSIVSWDTETLIKLFKFGGFVTISVFLSPILTNIEKIFLTGLRPISDLTYYSIPYSLIYKLLLIPSAVSAVIFPLFSYFQGFNKKTINKELHYRSTLYILLILIFFISFFIVFGRPFLALWIGNDFAEKSTVTLVILSVAAMVNAMSYPSISLLYGAKKPKLVAIFNIIEVIIHIPLSYVFIYYFGGPGAAIAWFLRVSLDTILVNRASCFLLGERLLVWYKKIFCRGFPCLVLCSSLFYLLKSFDLYLFSPSNISGILAIFIFYVYLVWKWGLDNVARIKILEFAKNIYR
jgi:O-antigen/teichoic acid export membrane protein